MTFSFSKEWIVFFLVWASAFKVFATYGRGQCITDARAISVKQLKEVERKFTTLNTSNIEKAVTDIPSQLKYEVIRNWSCGPNSIARAFILTSGRSYFSNESEYITFAKMIPKTVGDYSDHRFDKALLFNNFILNGFYQCLALLNIPYIFQSFCGKTNINMGLLPSWLSQYMNSYISTVKQPGVNFEFHSSDSFSVILELLKQKIVHGSSVIPLIVFDSTHWHYLNIIGFDDNLKSVIILDTDSKLYIWKYEALECLMNTGLNSYSLNPDELFSYFISVLGNQYSEINYFNIISVRPGLSQLNLAPGI